MRNFFKRAKGYIERHLVALLFNIKNIWLDMFRPCIVVNAWVDDHWLKGVRTRNFGDDINKYLIEEFTGKRVIFDHTFSWWGLLHKPNYLCIGSIIESHCNHRSIIWGSGAMYGNRALLAKPLKVCAVRGPLTRKYLLEQGVECPEIYGDPALLLPRVYKPSAVKKYRVGIIPHVLDADNKFIIDFAQREDVCVIDLEKYNHWHDIIDAILSCEVIVSSSLHGLIVSDAYDVPNVWIELSDKVQGNGFKFYDYYQSGGICNKQPLIIDEAINIDSLLSKCQEWEKPNIDTDKLYRSCPFV